MRKRAARCAAIALSVGAAVGAEAAVRVSAVGAYHEEVLDNGLRVILIEHRANPMVASSVVVGAGAVHEPDGMNGASHLLEHLLFGGTTTRTQRELYDEVDRYGAYNNATTREDHTLFTLLIQKEFAAAGLEIQADMLFRSTLPPERFDKEKAIVLEELAKDRNDPGYLAREAFRGHALAGTPLARSVLGTEASISAIEREALRAYYKSRYVPGNMILVVMGDFDRGSMREIVRRTFGAAPRGERPSGAPGTWPARPENNLATRPLEAGRTYLLASMPLPLAPHDPEMAAVELLVAALAGSDDAPLRRALTGGADPEALSLSLAVTPRIAPWSTLDLEVVLQAGRPAAPVLDRVAAALRSAGAPATLDRLATVRAALRAEEVLTADQIHYYALTRSFHLLDSPEGYLARRLETLDGIGPARLARAAARLAEAPESLRALVAGPGLEPREIAWRPPAAAPSPEPAAQRVARTLDSGLEVEIERNDDSRVFALHLLLRPRAASEPPGKEGIADFLHRLFLRGSLVHGGAALAARLGDLGARCKTHDDPSVPFDDYYTTPEFSFVRLEMPADPWREGVSLLAEIVRFPRWDADDIASVRLEMQDLLARREESTRARAQGLFARAVAAEHPFSRPVVGTAASIAAITAEDLRAFHGTYVVGSRMILTGVGPVDPEAVLAAVESAFAGLPTGEPRAVPPAPLDPPSRRVEEAVGKEQAVLVLGGLFDADPADEAALAVAGAMLSDALAFRLREEKGLAYSIAASIAPAAGRMRFEAILGTRQANVEEALEGLREGIERFRDARPEPAAVARAANGLRGRMLMRRLTRINQAYFAGLERMDGRGSGSDRKRLDAILAVRPADIRRVARKYLDPRKCVIAIVR